MGMKYKENGGCSLGGCGHNWGGGAPCGDWWYGGGGEGGYCYSCKEARNTSVLSEIVLLRFLNACTVRVCTRV